MDNFPECKIYCSQESKSGLRSEKENLSFYHEKPVSYHGENIVTVKDGDKINLFSKLYIEVIATPGHHPGCLSFLTENYIFTGDSFIPGYDVVTKLKGGSKIESQFSVQKIKQLMNKDAVLCAGHFGVLNM
jgi:glyoxylase-like metal-dependent hydrolase (beta-lactamase superfamily II)